MVLIFSLQNQSFQIGLKMILELDNDVLVKFLKYFRLKMLLVETVSILIFYCVIIIFLLLSSYIAVTHLHGAMLYGKKIHVVLSKHGQVQMPQPGSNVRYY